MTTSARTGCWCLSSTSTRGRSKWGPSSILWHSCTVSWASLSSPTSSWAPSKRSPAQPERCYFLFLSLLLFICFARFPAGKTLRPIEYTVLFLGEQVQFELVRWKWRCAWGGIDLAAHTVLPESRDTLMQNDCVHSKTGIGTLLWEMERSISFGLLVRSWKFFKWVYSIAGERGLSLFCLFLSTSLVHFRIQLCLLCILSWVLECELQVNLQRNTWNSTHALPTVNMISFCVDKTIWCSRCIWAWLARSSEFSFFRNSHTHFTNPFRNSQQMMEWNPNFLQ